MQRSLLAMAALVLILPWAFCGPGQDAPPASDVEKINVAATDWPWWRGPNRNGVADPKQQPPLQWSETENVRWKSPIPGRGHGSPTVVGHRVFLPTADFDARTQSVLCYDRDSGKLLWQTEVHQGNFDKKGNAKGSPASATVACDGTRVFINFLNGSAVYTTALNLDGKRLWQTKVTDFAVHQGFASSPALYQSLVLVSADNQGTGVVAGLERATGKIVWTQSRPKLPNYASPTILHVAGRDQLLMSGCDLVSSFEPLTGKKLWEIKGSTTECVTAPVTDGEHIYVTGGYPTGHVASVRADGSGKVAWQSGTKVYVPSMVADRGYLYAVLDDGYAVCLQWDTGKVQWKQRLEGGFTASLVLVGERLFATNESGRTFIFKATPKAYEEIGQNQLGKETLPTPAICGGRIYTRVATQANGRRQEMLYCIGVSP
jgi:outer membrane protein assembly factor BamB